MSHSAFIVCPDCEEGLVVVPGEFWTDYAHGGEIVPLRENCERCSGSGEIPDPDYDGPDDDSLYNGPGLEGGVRFEREPDALKKMR